MRTEQTTQTGEAGRRNNDDHLFETARLEATTIRDQWVKTGTNPHVADDHVVYTLTEFRNEFLGAAPAPSAEACRKWVELTMFRSLMTRPVSSEIVETNDAVSAGAIDLRKRIDEMMAEEG